MMHIKFIEAQLSADELLKQKSATGQMEELLKLLSDGVKYATLSVADRQMLLQKGFAKDLVDNLVFFTERSSVDPKHNTDDRLVLGYTHAAFDPSIYACDSIVQTLTKSHSGRCAYCESQIDHTSPGYVSHFRPAWGAMKDGRWNRDAYYRLAYDQTNLLLSCQSCHEFYKGSQFPTASGSSQGETLEQEIPLLVNPYSEDPRQFIRFNPLNGEAYAFDEFSARCKGNSELNNADVEQYVWAHPEQIPNQVSASASTTTQGMPSSVKSNDFKGQITIDVLGLNRPELIRSRLSCLRDHYGLFVAQQSSRDSSEIKSHVDKLCSEDSFQASYRSLIIDAIHSWSADPKGKTSWFSGYQIALKSRSTADTRKIGPGFTSCMQYMVLESELSLANKRRIVCLHSSDYLYGSDRKVKTVFLPINWESDFQNTIKVANPEIVWEASFAELAETQPVALQSLFANNEVWAEGNYAALS